MATARMRARREEGRRGERDGDMARREDDGNKGKRMKGKRAARAKDQTEEDQSNGVFVGDHLQMRTR